MQQTPKHIVLIVVLALVAIALGGMVGTYLLIVNKADPTLIAFFSGIGGTALGGLMTILSNTRSVAEPSTTTQTTTTKTEPDHP